MIQRILVPVDFGDASAAAVTLAGRLAQGCGAALTLLHAEALEAPLYFTSDQIEQLAAERRQRQAQAERYLETFGRSRTDAAFTSVIAMRPPVDAITEAARAADMVVIGTHRKRGPQLWWLGSVAERILRDLTTPVLVVHSTDGPARAIGRIAVHTAPGLSGANALALAMRIGQAVDAEVRDRRDVPADPATMFEDVEMVAMAEPWAHDRAWRTRVGEPLIRAGRGPVLFVPERAEEQV